MPYGISGQIFDMISSFLGSRSKVSQEYSFNVGVFLKKLGFTPCKAKQTLGGMELQQKEAQKD